MTYHERPVGELDIERMGIFEDGEPGIELAVCSAAGLGEASVKLLLHDLELCCLLVAGRVVDDALKRLLGKLLERGLNGTSDFRVEIAQLALSIVGSLDTRICVRLDAASTPATATATAEVSRG